MGTGWSKRALLGIEVVCGTAFSAPPERRVAGTENRGRNGENDHERKPLLCLTKGNYLLRVPGAPSKEAC